MLTTRPAAPDDLAAVTELYRACDVHFFGAPEHDESEVREDLGHVPDLGAQSLLVFDDDSLVGALWWWGHQTTLLAEPVPRRRTVIDLLLAAAVAADRREIDSLARDTDLIAGLEALGWRHARSAFELTRPVTDDWTLPEPVWPDGIDVGPARADELATLHAVIYDDAAWDEVDGHVRRELDEWQSIFITLDLSGQLVARRAGRPVGVALTRTFSDGTGWVGQLAVALPERGTGLGRALLLAGLRNRRDAGATALGLGVQAANDKALALYQSVGLRIERELKLYEPGR